MIYDFCSLVHMVFTSCVLFRIIWPRLTIRHKEGTQVSGNHLPLFCQSCVLHNILVFIIQYCIYEITYLLLYNSSDMQLAIALQQQEFEQQPQGQQRVLPQSPTTSRSGLVVGPQVGYQFSNFIFFSLYDLLVVVIYTKIPLIHT